MISQDRDYEELLRDALRAAAESVEPAGDGLERIRHRSHSRRSARSMLAWTADWLRLYRVRLSVRLESVRWQLSQRGLRRASTGAHRSGRTPAGKTATRPGPATAWLKPAFAVAAVVAVVVVGVLSLNRMHQTLFRPTNSVTSPGHQHARTSVTGLASPGQSPSGVTPNQPPVVSKAKSPLIAPLPKATCTATPTTSSTPTPTATATASPTPTTSSTATATPSATPSGTGSPSASPPTGTTSGAARATTDAKFSSDTGGGTPNMGCGSATSTPTPQASATS